MESQGTKRYLHLLLPQKGLESAHLLDAFLNQTLVLSGCLLAHRPPRLYSLQGQNANKISRTHTPLPSVTGLLSLPYLGKVQPGLAIFNSVLMELGKLKGLAMYLENRGPDKLLIPCACASAGSI